MTTTDMSVRIRARVYRRFHRDRGSGTASVEGDEFHGTRMSAAAVTAGHTFRCRTLIAGQI
jgi:methionyl-tRNA synthetase